MMKSWQFQHGAMGFLLPVFLVMLLVALRFNLIAELIRRVRLFLQLRGRDRRKVIRSLRRELYSELLRILARRGLLRVESQTPFEFAAAVNSPNLASPVREFTQIYRSCALRRRTLRHHPPAPIARSDSLLFARALNFAVPLRFSWHVTIENCANVQIRCL